MKLLTEPDIKNPMNPESAIQYSKNRGEYDTEARRQTMQYAISSD
jgi:ubiquitin-protein ligase